MVVPVIGHTSDDDSRTRPSAPWQPVGPLKRRENPRCRKGKARVARDKELDLTRLRFLLPVVGLVWVAGKLFGLTSSAIDTMTLVVIFGLTWDWIRSVSGRLEAVEKRLDEQNERERIEQLAAMGRDSQGRFAKKSTD